MAALTVRLPDDKYLRLKSLAKSRGTPVNRLIDEMTTLMLAQFDAETRFQLRAAWSCWAAVRHKPSEQPPALGLRLTPPFSCRMMA